MTTTIQDPIELEWTTSGQQMASATKVANTLGSFMMNEIPPHITPYLAAAGTELASIAGIDWRFSTDVPAVAMIRLISRVAIVTPQAAGPHTQRLAEQLDELRAR